MNIGERRLLLYITRSLNQLGQRKIGPGNVLLSRTRGLKLNEPQIMVSSRQFCGSCLEPMQTKNHTGITRSNGQKFLGSHQAGLFVQQQRFYSGDGRRWIMKQHFKGMPTPEVELTNIIITITIVITSRGCQPTRSHFVIIIITITIVVSTLRRCPPLRCLLQSPSSSFLFPS